VSNEPIVIKISGPQAHMAFVRAKRLGWPAECLTGYQEEITLVRPPSTETARIFVAFFEGHYRVFGREPLEEPPIIVEVRGKSVHCAKEMAEYFGWTSYGEQKSALIIKVPTRSEAALFTDMFGGDAKIINK